MSLRSAQVTLDQCHSGTMKLEEFVFITDFTILFQSTHFTRAAKGQEIRADLRSYQLTPPAPRPLPLFFPQCGWKQVPMENNSLILLKSMTLPSQYAVPSSPSNATQPLAFHLPFFSLTLAPCFCTTALEKKKSSSLAHTPPSCHHLVSLLLFYLCTGTDSFLDSKFSSSKPTCNGGTVSHVMFQCS